MTFLWHSGSAENRDDSRSAFTFFELLFVLVVVTALAIFLLPVAAKARDRSASFTALCLNNHRQLIAAAIMYADDNQDNWVLNQPDLNPSWCGLAMNFNAASPGNTNFMALTDPGACVIAPFVQDPRIYHCPADKSYVTGEGPRIRSVSMNGAVGTTPVGNSCTPPGGPVNGQWLTGMNISTSCQTTWRTYGKTSQMTVPTPANLWAFCDEHPDSINDESFAVQMEYTGPLSSLIDVPGSYHEGACSFSFADGHCELHKWMGQTIQPPIVFGGPPVNNRGSQSSADSADVAWLQQHTSAHQ